MEKENMFDNLNENEFSDNNEQEIVPEQTSNETEVMPSDFESFIYIKNPDVGQSVELIIKKVLKKPGRELKRKSDGQKFWTGLKDKNDRRTETIIETTLGERFSISSWGLYFGLFGKDSKLAECAKKNNNSYEGIRIRITHNFNGKDSSTNSNDLMKLRGFKTLEEADAHKKKVSAAMKAGTIYSVEILQ